MEVEVEVEVEEIAIIMVMEEMEEMARLQVEAAVVQARGMVVPAVPAVPAVPDESWSIGSNVRL